MTSAARPRLAAEPVACGRPAAVQAAPAGEPGLSRPAVAHARAGSGAVRGRPSAPAPAGPRREHWPRSPLTSTSAARLPQADDTRSRRRPAEHRTRRRPPRPRTSSGVEPAAPTCSQPAGRPDASVGSSGPRVRSGSVHDEDRRPPKPAITSSEPVQRHRDGERRHRLAGGLHVGPVDAGLVGLPPRPEGQRRRRRQEGEALHRRVGDRPASPAAPRGAGPEPVDQRGPGHVRAVVRPVDRAVPPALPDRAGRPAVDQADVPDQVGHLPGRRAGHGRGVVDAPVRRGQQLALLAQRGEVLGGSPSPVTVPGTTDRNAPAGSNGGTQRGPGTRRREFPRPHAHSTPRDAGRGGRTTGDLRTGRCSRGLRTPAPLSRLAPVLLPCPTVAGHLAHHRASRDLTGTRPRVHPRARTWPAAVPPSRGPPRWRAPTLGRRGRFAPLRVTRRRYPPPCRALSMPA